MSTMGLLASFTLWMYISTTTALSVSGGLRFLFQPLIEQDLSVAKVTAIHHIIVGQPLPGEDPVCAERNEGSNLLTELQKVQAVLQDIQAKDATINHTLTTHESELDRYKDEVATLTGIIQDQQSVIKGLQNFSNTLLDKIDGLSERINDQQNQTEWLKMKYDELETRSAATTCSDLECVSATHDCVVDVDEVASCQPKDPCNPACIAGQECVANTNGVGTCKPLNRCGDIQCPLGSTCDTSSDIPNCRSPVCIDGELTLNDTCEITVCTNGVQVSYPGPDAPFVPVPELNAKGCLVLVSTQKKTWEDARADCRNTHGGDLFVAGDLPGVITYIKLQGITECVHWGGRSRKWLDGTAVAFEEWDHSQPDGPATEVECLGNWQIGRRTHDIACTYPCYYLCQKGISYPITAPC